MATSRVGSGLPMPREPDARYEHPVLRSLGCHLRFGILPALGGIRRLSGQWAAPHGVLAAGERRHSQRETSVR
ncbi:MAG: hypothetical protein RLZZ21_1026 [Planctomycetota bacterium]|jgi:hypothetical protein